MNTINSNKNIYFGQFVPTNEFLKCSLNIHKYSDARNLVMSYDTRFPGKDGFTGKALKMCQKAIAQNPFLAKVVENLKQLPSKNAQELEIEKFIIKHGKTIDIEL